LATLYGDRTRHVRILAGHERIRTRLEEASLDAASDMPVVGGAGTASLSGMSATARPADPATPGAPSAPGGSMGSMGK
jgi:hypothetical protein